jgi:hypothetical protein
MKSAILGMIPKKPSGFLTWHVEKSKKKTPKKIGVFS